MVTGASVIYIFSFILAFCSLFYELVYAQILSVCIGGTRTQYLITISLFTCALGIGSLLFRPLSQKMKTRTLFLRTELLLTILGASGPFFIAWLLQGDYSLFKIITSYFFIFLIGLCSGLELPCLFSMKDNSHGRILAFDYGGMLAASLLFPFFFLPYLGTAAATLTVANLNGTAIIWLSEKKKASKTILFIVNMILFGIIIQNRESLNDLLSSLYLGAM